MDIHICVICFNIPSNPNGRANSTEMHFYQIYQNLDNIYCLYFVTLVILNFELIKEN